MPAKKKATREEMIEAAFHVLGRDGYQAVNARSIARELECSTQPIYHEFIGMQELKQELRKMAGESYVSRVQKLIKNGLCSRYTAYGLAFIQLAREEKELFRYLYMRELEEGETPYYDVDLPDTLLALSIEFGFSMEEARNLHTNMALFCQGIALGVNNGTLQLNDEEILQKMKMVFLALKAQNPQSAQEKLNDKQTDQTLSQRKDYPGKKKQSFSLAYNGGEIWCEHLDGLYEDKAFVLSKLEQDLLIMRRPSTSSYVAINLDETQVDEELLNTLIDKLKNLGRPLSKVVIVGLERKMQKLVMKKAVPWVMNCENDFEKAKHWLLG